MSQRPFLAMDDANDDGTKIDEIVYFYLNLCIRNQEREKMVHKIGKESIKKRR